MAVKDFDTSENKDIRKDEKTAQQKPSEHSADGLKIASTDIKNANATGDGSFGRSDEVPENGDQENMDNTY